MTPMRRIRAKCIDCMGGQISEVRKCPSEDCPLYVYRLGHRPVKGGGFSKAKVEDDKSMAKDTY